MAGAVGLGERLMQHGVMANCAIQVEDSMLTDGNINGDNSMRTNDAALAYLYPA